MYTELANQTWAVSNALKVSIANNSDFKIKTASKKITFSEVNSYAEMTFTSVNFALWEELCFYVYTTPQIPTGTDNLFRVTIGSKSWDFKALNKNDFFHFIQLHAADLGTQTKLRITSLQPSLTLFFDFPLYRLTSTADMDLDLLKAISDHLVITYGVTTTISADVAHGAKQIALTSNAYIYDNTRLRITQALLTEEVTLQSRDGSLATALVNDYTAGATVEAICPIDYGKKSELVTDPVCGVVLVDRKPEKRFVSVKMDSGIYKRKKVLGAIDVQIYIEGTAEKKVMQMARAFEDKYGAEFQIILDGELVDCYLESSDWLGREIGGLARSAYKYTIQPQAITDEVGVPIDDLTFNITSKEAE
jgi:hypothetical protein